MPIKTKTNKTATREPVFVKLTLEWCNRQRKKKGMKPLKRLPKGKLYKSESCPCGVATKLVVGQFNYYDPSNNNISKPLPKSVKQFVYAFDNRELPQYIKSFRKVKNK